METKVGVIQGYDVIYIPEKDCIFCKNTVVKYPLMEAIIKGDTIRNSIPEKQLTVTKNGELVILGCLTTTMENCLSIINKVKNYKR